MPQNTATEAMVRRYDYDDRTVAVADLGPAADPSVDVVDDTAIVVTDEDQHEIDLPDGDVRVFNRNGVVSFEVNA